MAPIHWKPEGLNQPGATSLLPLAGIKHGRNRADQPAALRGHLHQAQVPLLAQGDQPISGQPLKVLPFDRKAGQLQFHPEMTHHLPDQGAPFQQLRIQHRQAPFHRQLARLEGGILALELALVLAEQMGELADRRSEVGAFYWTDWAPDIVNSGREEQGSVSV